MALPLTSSHLTLKTESNVQLLTTQKVKWKCDSRGSPGLETGTSALVFILQWYCKRYRIRDTYVSRWYLLLCVRPKSIWNCCNPKQRPKRIDDNFTKRAWKQTGNLQCYALSNIWKDQHLTFCSKSVSGQPSNMVWSFIITSWHCLRQLVSVKSSTELQSSVLELYTLQIK